MKRFVSLLLTVCMCLSAGAALMAGEQAHTHSYKTDWASDDTHHWHACDGEDCTEVADQAEHTWDEGAITTEATASADGEKTYTCTACGATRKEPVIFMGVSKADWDAMLSDKNFVNYTLKQYAASSALGVSITTEHLIKNTKDKSFIRIIENGTPAGSMIDEPDDTLGEGLRSMIGDFENFTYNKETNTYTRNEPIDIEDLGMKDLDATVKLSDDGKLSRLEISYSVEFMGITSNGKATFTFSDYGTTVITAEEEAGATH